VTSRPFADIGIIIEKGGRTMSWFSCWLQNISKLTIGIFFLVMGMGGIVIGVTVLPIIGLIMSLPAFGLGLFFIKSHLNRQCEIAE
jgi:hypothetical protein